MKYVDILTTAADTKDNIVTFASGDEANPTAWKDVATLASKEKHSSLLNKISTMFSNVRYLYNILGTTDISALGTVTQAIATLNGNVGSIKGISSSAAITTQGQYALDAREKNASINGTLANELSKVNSNLEWKLIGINTAIPSEGLTYNFDAIKTANEVVIYFNVTGALDMFRCLYLNNYANINGSYIRRSDGQQGTVCARVDFSTGNVHLSTFELTGFEVTATSISYR